MLLSYKGTNDLLCVQKEEEKIVTNRKGNREAEIEVDFIKTVAQGTATSLTFDFLPETW